MHSSQRLQSSRLQIVSLKTGRFISFSRRIPDPPLGVSKNNGTPKSSILLGFSIINHPFCGTPIFGPPPPLFVWHSFYDIQKKKHLAVRRSVFCTDTFCSWYHVRQLGLYVSI